AREARGSVAAVPGDGAGRRRRVAVRVPRGGRAAAHERRRDQSRPAARPDGRCRARVKAGAAAAPGAATSLPQAVRDTLRFFWDSPFPATLQDSDFRLLDVNDAYLSFTGFS